LKKYEVGAFISQDDWGFSGSYNHDTIEISTWLEEGKTYSIWVGVGTDLVLVGLEVEVPFLGKVGYFGHGWGDISFDIDEILIDYHNPPESPPEGEHFPELIDFAGPSNLLVEQSGTFSADANDLDDDEIYYKWYWGDGTESDWTSSSKIHSYNQPGIYNVRVQVKDNSEYELSSNISEPIEVNVVRPDGPITLLSPTSGDNWNTGETYMISWTYSEEIGDEVFLTLIKEDNPSFSYAITLQPVSAYDKSYTWNIPSEISSGIDYRVIIWNNPSCNLSDKFTITQIVEENNPPGIPSTPSGPTSGKTGNSYTYKATATDPDGDRIRYKFKWGDDSESETDYYNSGEEGEKAHKWSSKGTYPVMVKVIDEHGEESDWSGYLEVEIKKKTRGKMVPGFITILTKFLERFPLFNYLLNLPIFNQLLDK